jgi:hypothetical protein
MNFVLLDGIPNLDPLLVIDFFNGVKYITLIKNGPVETGPKFSYFN